MPNLINQKIFNDFRETLINTKETQVFILTTHQGADFDDFSSLVGFLDYLNYIQTTFKLKIETHICLSGELDDDYLELTPNVNFIWRDLDEIKFQEYFKNSILKTDKVYNLVVFGCSDLKRMLGNPFSNFTYSLLNEAKRLVTFNFDHHIQGKSWANYNLVDEEASSNAENLLDILLSQLDYKISKNTATNLMIGLVSDTVNFFASSTTNLTHKHASELMNLGCDIAKVREIVHAKWTVENLTRLNDIIKKVEYLSLNDIIWTVENKKESIAVLDCTSDSEISNLFSNEILDILKTNIVIMIKNGQKQNDRKLSIRCLPESNVNAVDIATHFGGGGHRLAAGASIDGHDLIWFKEELVKYLSHFIS